MHMALEQTIASFLYSLSGTSGFVDGIFIFSARFLVIILTVIFLEKLLVHREPYERLTKIFFSAMALIIATGVFEGLLSYVVTRAHPADVLQMQTLLSAERLFFPAFATTWATTIAMITWLALSRRLAFWLFWGAALVGFSQVYVGLYWPLDALVGFAVGIVGPLLARRLIPLASR